MKEISLTQGMITIVDDDDYHWLNRFSWYAHYAGLWYACTSKMVKMHQLVLGNLGNNFIDHVNGNTLDNRKENLRAATPAQNQQNAKMREDNTTGFKGVGRTYSGKRFQARISVNGKRIFLGSFDTKEEAARVYDAAALIHFGRFARLNFPEDGSDYQAMLDDSYQVNYDR